MARISCQTSVSDEIQRAMHSSRVVVSLTLSETDCGEKIRPRRWLVVPRNCYLGSALEYSSETWKSMISAAVDVPLSPEGPWFSVIASTNVPLLALPCHLPFGVIIDLMGLCELVPIELELHLRNFPVDEVLSGSRERLFAHSLKQSLFVSFGSCDLFSNLSAARQKELWRDTNYCASDDRDAVSAVSPLMNTLSLDLFSKTPLRVPVRIAWMRTCQGTSRVVVAQPVVCPEKKLAEVLSSVFSRARDDICHTKETTTTTAAVTVDSSATTLFLPIVHGVPFAPETAAATTALEMWRAMKSSDGWLYIVLRRGES